MFTLSVRVYYEDTDAGGIVYYANYLKFMERARTEWLRHLGIESEKMMREQGVCFVVAKVEIAYKRPARLDDVLTVEATVESQTATRLRLRQNVTRGEDTIVEASVEIAMITLETGKATRIPDGVAALLACA